MTSIPMIPTPSATLRLLGDSLRLLSENTMPKAPSATAPIWPATLTRILLAVFGGYALTYYTTAALARLLPFERIDAAISATLLSFALYTCYVLWVYAVPLRRGLLSLLALVPLALIGFGPNWFGGAA